MTGLLWIIVGVVGAGLIAVLAVGVKRRGISFRPVHLRVIARDIVNYFRFSAGKHRREMADLHMLIGLPRGSLPATRGRAASPDFLLILAQTILAHEPRWILECGSGVSTLVIARTLQILGRGKVFSLEHLPGHAATVTARLAELGLADHGEVITAPLIAHRLNGATWQWYDTSRLPDMSWDLIVVDGPPASIGDFARYPVGPLMIPRLARSGRILVDDTARPHDQAVCRRLADEFAMQCEELPAEKGCSVLYRGISTPDEHMTYVMSSK